jgi:hypothetical protein
MPDPTGSEKTECEIEITPEMIEAGVMAYVQRDDVFETQEEIVSRIFRAMVEAKREGQASQSSPG